MGELTQTFNQVQAILNHAVAPTPSLATGTILAGGSGGAPTPIAIGTAGQVLTVTNSGTTGLAWAAPPASSGSSGGMTIIDFTLSGNFPSNITASTTESFSDIYTILSNGGYVLARTIYTDQYSSRTSYDILTNCYIKEEYGSQYIVFGGYHTFMSGLMTIEWDSSGWATVIGWQQYNP